MVWRSQKKWQRFDPSDVRSARNVAQMHSKRGDVLLEMKRTAQAIVDYEAGLAANIDLQKRAPTQSEYQRDVAASHKRLGMAYLQAGQGKLSAEHFEQALKFAHARFIANPEVPSIRRDFAVALGDRVLASGDLKGRCAQAAQSLAIWKGLEKDGILSPSDKPQMQTLQRIMAKGLACDDPARAGVTNETILQ